MERYVLTPQEATNALMGKTVEGVEFFNDDGIITACLHLSGDLTAYVDDLTVYANESNRVERQ